MVLILVLVSLTLSLFLVEMGARTKTTGLRATLRSPLAGVKSMFLDRSLYPMALIAVLWGVSSRMFTLYVPLYLSRNAGFDMAQIGLLFSLTSIAQAVGQPVSGWFVDKYGPVKALLLNEVGSGVLVLAFVAVTTTGDYSITVPAAFFILTQSSYLSAFGNTAYQVYVAKVTNPETRATVYSAIEGLSMLSQTASPVLGYALWTIRPQLVYVASSAMSFFCVPLILILRGYQSRAKEK